MIVPPLLQNTPEERGLLLLNIRQAGVRDIRVLRAIETTPRDEFTPFRFRDLANKNILIPIGCGQTMTRPTDLARSYEALEIDSHHRVLEIGAGSGYGTAILSKLASEVVTFERYISLAGAARERLASQNIDNVLLHASDGFEASIDIGQFDRIVIHLALSQTPQTLISFLKPGGIIIFGQRELSSIAEGARERLVKVNLKSDGVCEQIDIGACRLGVPCQGASKYM
ncbi:MAG: protein-L-isoaspartate O-methyltransferase family protein [Methylocystis sp.]